MASGAKQTLHAVSSFDVLRVPARERPGGGDASHSADGRGEGGTELRARYHERFRTLQVGFHLNQKEYFHTILCPLCFSGVNT